VPEVKEYAFGATIFKKWSEATPEFQAL